MSIGTFTLWIFLAGALAGLALGIQIDTFRDTPWVLRRLYRYWRHHERPDADDLPPSLRAYFQVDPRRDVRRRSASPDST